ncbi:MAG: DUF4861 family protein, partial [Parafilimonas sp.]
MRKSALYILFIFFAFSCNVQTHTFSILNSLAVERTDELIILKRTDLEKQFGNIADGKFIEIKDAENNPVVVQLDDLTDDKKWDEAVFLYSFKPKQKETFSINITDENSYANTIARAHVRLRKKNADDTFGDIITKEIMPDKNPPTDFSKQALPLYLTEGPAWENDKLAFRLYFDTRNGKDIFGKIIPGMVMDTIGANVNASYHNLSNWGMDVLHVGNSLGGGAIAFKLKENGKDTLIRLGGDNITKETYQQIADGPLLAIFRITYNWMLNNKPVEIIDETSIWGGQYFYQTKISIKNAPAPVELVTGIADFNQNKSGDFTEDNAAVLYSAGPQSENHDWLDMAVIIFKKNYTGVGEAPKEDHNGPVVYKQKIFDTYYITQTINDNDPAVYRFYAGWEKTEKNFASADYFKSFIKNQAVLFSTPVQ